MSFRPRSALNLACLARLIGLAMALLVACSLVGCALGTTIHVDGTKTHHYFGYVAVHRPEPRPDQVFSDDTAVIGLRVSNGIGVGYMRDRQFVVPLDCRLVLVVRTQAQLDEALARLGTLSDACAVIDTSLQEHR